MKTSLIVYTKLFVCLEYFYQILSKTLKLKKIKLISFVLLLWQSAITKVLYMYNNDSEILPFPVKFAKDETVSKKRKLKIVNDMIYR